MHCGNWHDYQWLECVGLSISAVLQSCPEALIERCIVVSSFDSGPLKPTAEEVSKGWRQSGDLLIVPRIRETGELPLDQYDEWYVFATETIPSTIEVFVNDPRFTLLAPAALAAKTLADAAISSQPDLVGAGRHAAELVEFLIERQSVFWRQIGVLNPESYISDGDRFILVTRLPELFAKISAVASTR